MSLRTNQGVEFPHQIRFFEAYGLDRHTARVKANRLHEAPIGYRHWNRPSFNFVQSNGRTFGLWRAGLWGLPVVLTLGWMISPLPQEMKERWGCSWIP